jgi:uncharacterized SAM-binding protein YcdF (DUF218 family)
LIVADLLKYILPGSIGFLLLAYFLGHVIIRRKSIYRWGWGWLAFIFLLYLEFSMPVVSSFIAAPLASSIKPLHNAGEASVAKAIVVLDISDMRYRDSKNALEFMDSDGVLRALEAARVYRLLSGGLIIVSGGSLAQYSFSDGAALREILIQLGVAPQHIALDSFSHNTQSHTKSLAHILKERGVSSFVLVTSPTYIGQSILAFRVVGFNPIQSPSASIIDDIKGIDRFLPSSKCLLLTEQAMHDYVG